MAIHKHELYLPHIQLLSGFSRAFGHPARPTILQQIHSEDHLCVQAIQKGHRLSKEALSEHLKILRQAQFVRWEERFPFTFYSLNYDTVEKAEEYFNNFFLTLKNH